MGRSLKVEEWPEPDRLAWLEACRPSVRLRRGGRAAHMKEATRADLEGRFGSFLGFLKRTGRIRFDQSALALIQSDIIGQYIADLQTRVSTVSVHGSVCKMRRMAEILDPELDFRWLREIELDLADQKRPAPKGHRVVSSDKILAAGVALICKAEAETHRTDLQRARMARNGLLIAFLAVCPIRLKNLASLTIGETIVRDGDEWWLLLPASDTKSGRLDHRVIPDLLARWIDRYLEKFIPVFPFSGSAMWPSRKGGGLSPSAIWRATSSATRQTLGKAISPHMFRHCVPYTIANIDGSQIGLASSVLQHSDPRTTEKHYNLARSVQSSRVFGEIISGLLTSQSNLKDEHKSRS